MTLSCASLTGSLTISPANSGFIPNTNFNLFGSVTSSDFNWVTGSKLVQYDLYGVSVLESSVALVTSITTTDFFSNLNLYSGANYYALSSVINVSSQDTGICSLQKIISGITFLQVPVFGITVTATNVTATADSTLYIQQSGTGTFYIYKDLTVPENDARLAIQVESNTGFITSFYPDQTFTLPITNFGITIFSITGFPLISSENLINNDYIAQSNALGFNSENVEIQTFQFINPAYAVSANLNIFPKYSSIITTTGYSPYKSVYPSNTGTVFVLQPQVFFTNYSSVTALTSVSVNWLTSPITAVSVYDTLTSTSSYYEWEDSVYPYVDRLYSVFASISGEFYTPTSTLTQKYITFVDPPSVSLSLSSTNYIQQESSLVVERNISFAINITGELPYAYVFNTGLAGINNVIFNTPTSVNLIVPDSYIAGTPYTATLCAFPLLSAIQANNLSTYINYITGSARTIETGVLPIIKNVSYIFSLYDNVIPAENIQVDFNTSQIIYNNEVVAGTYNTNVNTASAFIYKNQFNQTISPEVSVIAKIASTSNETIQDLYNSINNRDQVYLNLTFNSLITSSIFSLSTLTTACEIKTTAPLGVGEITVTARPKDSLNITTKTIPYTGFYYDFITPTIYFNKFTPSWYASYVNPNKFEVIIWNDTEHTIDKIQTYVDGSNSYPYNPDFTRYSRLVPQWWFQDESGSKSETFLVTNNKLYNSYDNSYIGTSGIASFYFKDDSPTGPAGELLVVSPVVSGIIAAVDKLDNITDQPSYANSKQSATQIYYVSHLHPTKLNITRDGIRDLKKYYWYTNPIPNTITIDTIENVGPEYGIDFSYPYDNNNHVFTIGLSGYTVHDYVTSPEVSGNTFSVSYYNTSFKATDDNGLIATGFVRTSVYPVLSSGVYQLIASTTVQPSGQYAHTPYAWVCDNKNNLVSRLYYNDVTKQCSQNEIKQQYMSVPVSGVTNMLSSNVYGTDSMSLTGTSDASNIAIDSLYNAWVVDGANDIAYKISVDGKVVNTVSFPQGSTPGSVCVDGDNNVWFTLVDDISALKYSESGEFLASVVSPVSSENYVDNPYKPGGIDTDLQNNVWITFYNSVCSVIGKYTPAGDLLTTIPLPPFYSPIDIIIDGEYENTAWVISENNSISEDYYTGAIHKIANDTSEIILSGFNSPQYFNIDANRNLWLLLGNNYLLQQSLNDYTRTNLYDLNALTLNNGIQPIVQSIYEPGSSINFDTYNQEIDEQLTESENNYTGIGGHSNGSIWILDNKNNKTLILTPQQTNDLFLQNSFNIYPPTPLIAGYNDVLNIGDWNTNQYTVTENSYFYQVQDASWETGIQARGDWTGLRRTLKYCPPSVTSAYVISGASEPFEIKTSPPGIRTLNDSYDLSQTLSNIFPDILSPTYNPVLHNEFLPGALGTDQSDYQTIGRQYFEKIANFVRNHNDVDFCNVQQLYSIARMLNVSIDNYDLTYPADVRRALDVLSIQHKRLFGDIDNYNRRFYKQTVTEDNDNITTIQNKLNYSPTPLSATTILVTGQPLVAHDLVSNKFDLLYINQQTELKHLSGYGLRYPVYNFDADTFNQYKFYNYKPSEPQAYVNSFIDWNSTYTTLVSSASSIDEWYKDDGIVDQIFNYYLNKGLGFINT